MKPDLIQYSVRSELSWKQELEMTEPELWFRMIPKSAQKIADQVDREIKKCS